MDPLSTAAPAFVEMAHRIVRATAATVDRKNRPRTRILHPTWVWGNRPTTRARSTAGPLLGTDGTKLTWSE
jgi:hypothetical protein